MSNISERIFQNAEVPFEIRKVFANAGEPIEEYRGQVLLWRECVARAVMDALGHTGQSEPDRHNAILLDAQKWFTEGIDTAEVFENADLPLEITLACVTKHFSSPKDSQKDKGDSPIEKIPLTKNKTASTGDSKGKRKPNDKVNKARRAPAKKSSARVSKPRKKSPRTHRVSNARVRRKAKGRGRKV